MMVKIAPFFCLLIIAGARSVVYQLFVSFLFLLNHVFLSNISSTLSYSFISSFAIKHCESIVSYNI